MRLCAFLFALVCWQTHATETDSWTYRSIELKDASQELNDLVNRHMAALFLHVNGWIKSQAQKGKMPSDTEVESQLAKSYADVMFNNSLRGLAIGRFETCIDSALCQDFPYIERISLYPNESVYYEANYSLASQAYVAAQLQVCGVRFGSDKFTHMFDDGFGMYNVMMSVERPAFDRNSVERASQILEEGAMGMIFTGVYSESDVAANLAGFDFFEIYFRQAKRSRRTGLLVVPHVDLCHFINVDFDETKKVNRFAEDRRTKALDAAIASRSYEPWIKANAREILARKIPTPKDNAFSVWAAGAKVVWIEATQKKQKDEVSTFELTDARIYPPEKRKAAQFQYIEDK